MLGLILAYGAVHAGLRFLRDTIGVDDVEQVILAQSWDLGYNFRQPPLYTWLLAAVQEQLGPGLPALVLLRYGCLVLAFWFCYCAARRLPLEPRLAGMCALSLTLLYQIGWKMHVGVTHTVLLTTVIFATAWVLLRLLRRPSGLSFLMLGAVVGLGLLTKYGYIAAVLLLAGAALLQRPGRDALLRPNLVVVPVIALLLLSPYLYWVAVDRYDFAAMAADTLGTGDDALGPVLARLAGAVAGFVAPLAFLVCLVMPRLLLPRQAACPGPANPVPANPAPANPAPAGSPPPFDAERWLRHSLVLAVAVLVLAAAGGWSTEFKERWMHPFLLVTPLWLFARIAKVGYGGGDPVGERRLAWLWWLMLAVAVIAVLFRLGQDLVGGTLCGRCRLMVPFTELADRLRAAGFTGGTILASDEHIGGNLRIAFPASRVLSLRYPFYRPPALPRGRGGQCLVVWDGRHGDSLPKPLDSLAQRALAAGSGTAFLLGEQVAIGAREDTGAPYVWYFHLDIDGRGACR